MLQGPAVTSIRSPGSRRNNSDNLSQCGIIIEKKSAAGGFFNTLRTPSVNWKRLVYTIKFTALEVVDEDKGYSNEK